MRKILIIGAGISGAVLAERFASEGSKVTIMEKRNHIGGNCYDYVDENGIRVSEYGAHLFHTNNERVWEYVNRFSEWVPWEHKVLARVGGKTVPVPVNIETVNILFNAGLQTEADMKAWLDQNRTFHLDPTNGQQAVLAKVGPELYEALFRHYTKKQWDKYPEELDASVLNRIPVRTNFDNRYFSDFYQALPAQGYTAMFERMLAHPSIEVQLSTDFFDFPDIAESFDLVFYTGPIDRFFRNDPEFEGCRLEYRSIRFEKETVDIPYFQENSVVNYCDPEPRYTRIVEYKHFLNQKSKRTTIVREFTTDVGDPYYPVPNPKNAAMYQRFKEKADQFNHIFFVGRLANYKYFNMDEAFKNALELYDHITTEFVAA